MKKTVKKLKLGNETLRRLDSTDLDVVAGGGGNSKAKSLCYSLCTDRTSCGIACTI